MKVVKLLYYAITILVAIALAVLIIGINIFLLWRGMPLN